MNATSPGPAMRPTAEQNAATDFILTQRANLLLNARAGAAKTTTLILIAKALPKERIGAIAFNKKIATELKERMPTNCECSTMNAIGYQAWRKFLGRFPSVNGGKVMGLFKALLEEVSDYEKKVLWDDYQDVLEAVSAAKSRGFAPEKYHPALRPLETSTEDFFDSLDVNLSGLQKWAVLEILKRSFAATLRGEIDFDDQLYCSALMPVSFPSYTFLMVDEAQDLSPINHAILRKMMKGARLLAVGDPCQAIYGFRGADADSMPNLKKMFEMEELSLTLCFRSDASIIRNARWRAPDMAHRENAEEGIVATLGTWSSELLQPGDAIICRNNAPLFRTALRLLRVGLRPELSGGQGLKVIGAAMKKLGKASTPRDEALLALEKWKIQAQAKYKSKDRADDLAECMEIFLREAKTLGEAIARFTQVLEQSGSIHLMTGHRSKGLEFDRVFFLDRHLIRKEGQDLNIRYVIETRPKHALYYVRSEDWEG
jgi:DNA helicase II / ATP-dependent DNA helicase PcrA